MDILKRASFFEKLALNVLKKAEEDYLGVKELDDVSTPDQRNIANLFTRACDIASSTLSDWNVETQPNGTVALIARAKELTSDLDNLKAYWSIYFEQILNRLAAVVGSFDGKKQQVVISAHGAILDGWDEIEKLGFKPAQNSIKPGPLAVPAKPELKPAVKPVPAKPVAPATPTGTVLEKTIKNIEPPASPDMTKSPKVMKQSPQYEAPKAPIPGKV